MIILLTSEQILWEFAKKCLKNSKNISRIVRSSRLRTLWTLRCGRGVVKVRCSGWFVIFPCSILVVLYTMPSASSDWLHLCCRYTFASYFSFQFRTSSAVQVQHGSLIFAKEKIVPTLKKKWNIRWDIWSSKSIFTNLRRIFIKVFAKLIWKLPGNTE